LSIYNHSHHRYKFPQIHHCHKAHRFFSLIIPPKSVYLKIANFCFRVNPRVPAEGAACGMPAQGRAPLKFRRVWRRVKGGLRYPSPSPHGFPLSKDNRWGLLRKPAINSSKGEEQPLPRGQGLRRSEQRRRPCRRCSLFKAASMPPRPCPAAAGRTPPTQGRGSVMRRVVRSVLLGLSAPSESVSGW
jgi:hypothetical protein